MDLQVSETLVSLRLDRLGGRRHPKKVHPQDSGSRNRTDRTDQRRVTERKGSPPFRPDSRLVDRRRRVSVLLHTLVCFGVSRCRLVLVESEHNRHRYVVRV